MTTELWLRLTLLTGIGLGTGLLAWWSGLVLGEVVRRVWQLTRPRRRRWLEQTLARWTIAARTTETAESNSSSPSLGAVLKQWRSPAFLALLGGMVLGGKAALSGSPVLGLFLFGAGIVLQRYFTHQPTTARERARLADAAARVIETFRSAYLVTPSVFQALAEAVPAARHPRVQHALERALNAHQSGQSLERALEPLDQVGDPHLSQLAFVLRRVGASDNQAIIQALEDLARRLTERRRIVGRLRVAMASINATVRFLEVANLALLTAIVFVPFWWEYYVQHPAILMAGVSLALVAFVYFDLRTQELLERAL